MADEVKKYLDYDGLKHLVEKLTDRIEASSSGTAVEDGVYVGWVDERGVEYITPPDRYDGSGYPIGPVVVEGGRGVLVAPETCSANKWANANYEDTLGLMSDDEDIASLDFDGRRNTILAVLKDVGGGAFKDCFSYSYSRFGPRRWHLGSLGEWKMVVRWYDDVQHVLSLLGMAMLVAEYNYWSSTQFSDIYAWWVEPSTGKAVSASKTALYYGSNGNVRPFATFSASNVLSPTLSPTP